MVGFPMLSGFISKLLFAASALKSPEKMMATLIVLAVSTTLNAIYFLRLVITLYSAENKETEEQTEESVQKPVSPWKLKVSVTCFILLNLILGLSSQPIVGAITKGLAMFG